MPTTLNGSEPEISQDEWMEQAATKPLDLEEMEKLIELNQALWAKVDELQIPVKEAKAQAELSDAAIMKALQDAGKKKYAANIGTIVIRQTPQVTTPKTIEAKQKFFKYLEQIGGVDLMWSYISINSQSLNTWYREAMDRAEAEGTLSKFAVPGIDGMTHRETLSFTKAKQPKGKTDANAN